MDPYVRFLGRPLQDSVVLVDGAEFSLCHLVWHHRVRDLHQLRHWHFAHFRFLDHCLYPRSTYSFCHLHGMCVCSSFQDESMQKREEVNMPCFNLIEVYTPNLRSPHTHMHIYHICVYMCVCKYKHINQVNFCSFLLTWINFKPSAEAGVAGREARRGWSNQLYISMITAPPGAPPEKLMDAHKWRQRIRASYWTNCST